MYDFAVENEHLFLRNNYSEQELKQPEEMQDLKHYYEVFDYFIHIVVLLNKYCYKNIKIKFVDHDIMKNYLDVRLNSPCNSFLELYEVIEDFKIEITIFCKNPFQNKNINKIIGFVYTKNYGISKKYFHNQRCIFKQFS